VIFGSGTETPLTYDEAKELLARPGYDAYGPLRLYGVILGGDTDGQAVAIKSHHNLDRFTYSRIYSVRR